MEYSLGMKEDAGLVVDRFEAFYRQEVIDRALVTMTVVADDAPPPPPVRQYPTLKDRWLDVETRAEEDLLRLERMRFYGDAMPIVWPNLGPEIFSACSGSGYVFGEDTTWSEPVIENWDEDAGKTAFNPQHPLFLALERYSEALIGRSRGKCIVGLTDLHPGADHLAALRDPANLAMDLLDRPQEVKNLLARTQEEYLALYDRLYAPIKAEGMPATAWLPGIHFGRYYIPSCDFSAMISRDQYDEFFLPGLIEECAFYDRSIYHLDGPGAIRHLDSILSIPTLNAIQWVPGAGHEELPQWIPLLKRIRDGGKSVMIYCAVAELDLVFEEFRPEGVWIVPIDVRNEETARAVLSRVEAWR